ncbi:uncharacterized protein SPSC_04016 [Sporisorium scitamineum]|uniref:Matrin-type domain-containing protein n=1 Tax=Sporisorium scitamineum TaxID=49012 RepID=A0A0F7RSX5_9BASI|nr:hypothetical protein [Sporisorium scitamineum]CDU24515.1 uncharacterized protein SPSC_04016 [Sporisorium scitamineum]
MADVWISRKRWTCKYCDITINDDLPSRRHHETGVRHKQNVQKALADLYRKGEQERKDAEHMRKEMARIEALAAESHAKDLASSDDPAASSSQQPAPSAASSSSSKLATPSRVKPQSGLSSLPHQSTRPLAEEKPQPIAQPGEWEQVQPVSSASTSYANETSDRDRARSFRMREKLARLNDSDNESDLKNIKIKKRPRKQLDAQDGPSLLPIGVKKEQADPADTVKEEADASSRPYGTSTAAAPTSVAIKKEESGETPSSAAIKEEADSSNSGGGSLFKKRKAGAGAGAKRVRAVI